MTDKARELLERAAEILELLFEGPNDVDPNTLAMLGDTRLEEIRAYLAGPEVKREALSDEEIGLESEAIRKWNLGTQGLTGHGWFSLGVRWAEQHHGIGGMDE